MSISISTIKSHFPIFKHIPDLVYLDSAATSQKPDIVIQCLTSFYEKENANIHRGLYPLASNATTRYEDQRKKVADFIGATRPRSIAFTKGTTESINIVAHGFLTNKMRSGDNVVITAMEHHANLIPWQQVCKQKGVDLRMVPVTPNGEVDMKAFHAMVDANTKMVAVTHISNTLGTINPIEEIIHLAHQHNAPVLIDSAQSISHYAIDVDKLDVDFLVFSAHKMYGPMGVGVLYTKEKYWSEINPLNFGGGAIKNVELEHTKFLDYPFHLEAGTPNVAGVVGLGAAIDFIQSLEANECLHHIENLGNTLREMLKAADGFKILGNATKRSGIVSFYHDTIHPHDIASFLGSHHIAVRAGHHCTQPLLKIMGVPTTVRASFSIYNSIEDVNTVFNSLRELKKFWHE